MSGLRLRHLLSDESWLVRESGFDPGRAGAVESRFTVGNGRVGTRATLEEGSPGERSGTFLAGVYDGHDSTVTQLVNAPDWLSCTVTVDGVELGVETFTLVDHERVLDLQQGLLWRTSVFADARGRRTRLETLRFASMARRDVCVQRVVVTAENHESHLRIAHRLDGRRRNLDRLPAYPDGYRCAPDVRWEKWALTKHLVECGRSAGTDGLYLEMQTRQTRIRLGYASVTASRPGDRCPGFLQRAGQVEEAFELTAPAGVPVALDKVVCMATSREDEDVRRAARSGARDAADAGVDRLLAEHRTAWRALWADCDCEVVGDAAATQALRFSVYHLLIAANPDDDTVNIGAKSLSGEGYRGHVFWDTEAVMLPFFVHTRPETAQALLRFRHHTLPAARQLATDSGCRGARYPWEAAASGREECPEWTEDGQNRFWTRDQELHVTADVVHGIFGYVAATDDVEFLHRYGAEIVFETSRFWVDRCTPSDDGAGYSLRGVMGPDEFHSHVDDNAFTNVLVAWALRRAVELHEDLAEHAPDTLADLARRIRLRDDEPARWLDVADRLVRPAISPSGVVEQFAGYFARKDVRVEEWDENQMPRYPPGYHHFNCEDTMLLKQPDVVMLMHLLPDELDAQTALASYDFYEARTLHKSSLSPGVHATVALRLGRRARALDYFYRSALVDLADNQGNTEFGMHIASAANTWLILVNGFGGFRLTADGAAAFDPWLPAGWKQIRFRVRCHGHRLVVRIDHRRVSMTLQAPDDVTQPVLVAGTAALVRGGTTVDVPHTIPVRYHLPGPTTRKG